MSQTVCQLDQKLSEFDTYTVLESRDEQVMLMVVRDERFGQPMTCHLTNQIVHASIFTQWAASGHKSPSGSQQRGVLLVIVLLSLHLLLLLAVAADALAASHLRLRVDVRRVILFVVVARLLELSLGRALLFELASLLGFLVVFVLEALAAASATATASSAATTAARSLVALLLFFLGTFERDLHLGLDLLVNELINLREHLFLLSVEGHLALLGQLHGLLPELVDLGVELARIGRRRQHNHVELADDAELDGDGRAAAFLSAIILLLVPVAVSLALSASGATNDHHVIFLGLDHLESSIVQLLSQLLLSLLFFDFFLGLGGSFIGIDLLHAKLGLHALAVLNELITGLNGLAVLVGDGLDCLSALLDSLVAVVILGA